MSVSTMKKLTVITPAVETDRMIRRLLRLRCVQVSERAPNGTDGQQPALSPVVCDGEKLRLEKRVAQIRDAIAVLDPYDVKPRPWNKGGISADYDSFLSSGRYDAAYETVCQALDMTAELDAMTSELAGLADKRARLAPWLSDPNPLDVQETKTGVLFRGCFPPHTDELGLDGLLTDISCAFAVISGDETGVYVTALCLRDVYPEVMSRFTSVGMTPVTLSDMGLDGTCDEADRLLAEKQAALNIRHQLSVDKLKKLGESLTDVRILYDVDNTSLLALEQKSRLSASSLCTVLEGWVPEDKATCVSAALDRLDCAYDMTDPAPDDIPPVLLKNNGYASNFEWVVGMYSYPKYGTYDPTFVMSIFYFLIFGLMFADVGYGLVLVIGGLLGPVFLHLKPSMKRSFNMFGYCGISSMIMGVLFGGWFGDLPYALMTNFLGLYETTEAAKEAVPFFNGLWINPIDDPMTFLVISLGMGGIHLIGGMVVKFCLLCKQKKVFAAIFDIGSWWVIFAGIGVLALVDKKAGLITLGVGVAMVVLTAGREAKNPLMKLAKGLLGLYDIVNYASDLLSYSRILALGLASAVIAQVFNLLATMGGTGVVGIILFIVVIIIGHLLNLAINVLGSFVHTSRLQYLEFFGKFFEEGGTGFVPCVPSDEYSTVETPVDGNNPSA